MIQRWVQVINTDGVDAQSLHKGGVTEAEGAIAERIDSGAGFETSGSSRLIANFTSACEQNIITDCLRYADDLKAVAGDVIDKIGTLDLDILHCGYSRNCQREEGEEELLEGRHAEY